MESSNKVVVTGCSGKTGKLIMKKLIADSKFPVRGILRSEVKKASLKQELGDGADLQIADVTKDATKLENLFKGCDTLIVCTSAIPKISFQSLFWVIIGKFFCKKNKPTFWYPENEGPDVVDYLGQKNQFDQARKAGIKHVILVSSMQGTNPEHFINTQMGNVSIWKRKAEHYLRSSGLEYTIIHPGGLKDESENQENVCIGVNDSMTGKDDETVKSIGKEYSHIRRPTVARFAADCVNLKTAYGKSFDIIESESKEGFKRDTPIEEILTKGQRGLEFDYSFNVDQHVKLDPEVEKRFYENLM